MINRRQLIKSLGAASLVSVTPFTSNAKPVKPYKTTFKYCLNTSTISGQKPGIKKYIEYAADAGYDGVELWIRDIQAYQEEGNSLKTLRKLIDDSNLKVENAIGFAPWMVNDKAKRKEGFQQMEEEMNIMAELGCSRIAAPAAGVSGDEPLNLFEVGERYAALLELGRKTGVMPQLEFWGAHKAFYHLGQTLMAAAVTNDPDVRFLPDIYHLFRGGSGFEGLKMMQGHLIEVFHMNDFVGNIPRETQADKDRVYPGDGVAPLQQVLTDLSNMGGEKVLSLELFNRVYWKQDPLEVAKTGLRKMKEQVARI